MKNGKVKTQEPIQMLEGFINPLQNTYTYLGISQTTIMCTKQTKSNLTESYIDRTQHLLQNNLSSKNIIAAINMFCVPLITYASPCLDWTEEELRRVDIET